jgi:high-affinity iron transporter
VLTWMIFWMKRQSRAIKGELEHKIDAALQAESVTRGLVLVVFVAVLREGIEAALFLVAAATGTDGSQVLVGGLIGLAIAAALGGVVYMGGHHVPMKTFFTVTGMIVIVFAAGLCAKTVQYLQASGELSSANWALYDVTSLTYLTVETQLGRFLGALTGWDPRPSIEQVIAWLGYFVPVTYLFLRRSEPAIQVQHELEPNEPAVPISA